MPEKPRNSRENVKTEVKGDKLIIEVDLTVAGELSASQKNIVVASTGGNKSVDCGKHGQFNLGVNFYKPK